MSRTTTILATGLGQGKLSNGLAVARRRILEADPQADVQLFSYKEHERIPKLAQQFAESGSRLVFAGHSFGVWWGSLLAAELFRYGTRIAGFCSADGVGRHPLGSALVISPSVVELHSWRQSKSRIRGSEIKPESPWTKWITDEHVYVRHAFVDEVQSFQDAVFECAHGGNP